MNKQQLTFDLYQIDAFTDQIFRGNPAAVVPLREWLPDEVMRRIAAENNLSETAFFLPDGEQFKLRWFTPTVEMDLCGHATLASAFVIREFLQPGRTEPMVFSTMSGELRVRPDGDWLALDFPASSIETAPESKAAVSAALGQDVVELYRTTGFLMAVLAQAQQVGDLAPDIAAVNQFSGKGIFVTAKGEGEVDFVSRLFAPQIGIPEDPVTGAIHCGLIPFWSRRLQKKQMLAHQVSPRGGVLRCVDRGERVDIAGQAVCYLKGTINIPG